MYTQAEPYKVLAHVFPSSLRNPCQQSSAMSHSLVTQSAQSFFEKLAKATVNILSMIQWRQIEISDVLQARPIAHAASAITVPMTYHSRGIPGPPFLRVFLKKRGGVLDSLNPENDWMWLVWVLVAMTSLCIVWVIVACIRDALKCSAPHRRPFWNHIGIRLTRGNPQRTVSSVDNTPRDLEV